MVDRPALIVACKALKAEGRDDEGLMTFLRAEGCNQIDSVVVLCSVLEIDLRRGKALVHLSQTWADMREASDRLHEQIVRSLGAEEE